MKLYFYKPKKSFQKVIAYIQQETDGWFMGHADLFQILRLKLKKKEKISNLIKLKVFM